MFNSQRSFGQNLVTAAIWAGVALSLWYWTQAWLSSGRGPAVPPTAVLAVLPASNPAALARLLGAPPAAVAGPGPGPAERFVLLGVVAGVTGQGAALIAVDGQPAAPYAVGQEIAPGYLLQAVGPHEAMLADGPRTPVRAVLYVPEPGITSPAKTTGALASAPVPAARPYVAPSAPPAEGPPTTALEGAAAAEPIPNTAPSPRGDSRRQAPPPSRRPQEQSPDFLSR